MKRLLIIFLFLTVGILNAEKVSLSGDDILNITDNKCTVMRYQDLEKFQNIDHQDHL